MNGGALTTGGLISQVGCATGEFVNVRHVEGMINMSLGSRITKKNRVIKYLAEELAATLDVLALEQNTFIEETNPRDLVTEAYKAVKK
jgi:hypothetical protein